MKYKKLLKTLKKDALLIGSRGLKVNDEKSDYDFVVSNEYFDSLFDEISSLITKQGELKEYFNVTPPLGNNKYIRIMQEGVQSIDIIVVEGDYLEIYKKVIKEMKKIDPIILINKNFRVDIFEEYSIHYGFKRNEI